jgi:hypothetical protein
MERVLIVAKTHMKSGACISGLTRSYRGIRLIPKDRLNHPANTEFDVGQTWNIEFQEAVEVDPPHVEDVIIIDKQYVGRVDNLRGILMKGIQPWRGGPECLFDNMITVGQKNCYISRSGPIPNCSTGYWLPDRPLILDQTDGKSRYLIEYKDKAGTSSNSRTLAIPFVGFVPPLRSISPETLVRVSLARWFAPAGEERCYLQISGWYL